MSDTPASERLFNDALRFFKDLQGSIERTQKEHADFLKKELETMRSELIQRQLEAQTTIVDLKKVIQAQSDIQKKQTQYQIELEQRIVACEKRITELTQQLSQRDMQPHVKLPIPPVTESTPATQIQEERAGEGQTVPVKTAKSSKTKVSTAKSQESREPTVEGIEATPVAVVSPESSSIGHIPDEAVLNEPGAASAATMSVEHQTESPGVIPEKTSGDTTPSEDTEGMKHGEFPVTQQATSEQTLTNQMQSHAAVLERFLALEKFQEIKGILSNQQKLSTTLTKHLDSISKLPSVSITGTYAADVVEFSLNIWLFTLLLKHKDNTFMDEMRRLYAKSSETTKKFLEYQENPKVEIAIKIESMMSTQLKAAYRVDKKAYIKQNEAAIKAITGVIEKHCEGIDGAESQVWIKFLKKWLAEQEEK